MKKILLYFLVVTSATFALDISENKHVLNACNNGNLKKCYQFARHYYVGVIEEAYPKEYYQVAIEPYRKACNGNIAEACYDLGVMYVFEKGVDRDKKRGYNLLEKACSLRDINACYLLGFEYEIGNGVKRDYHKALEMYTKECNIGKTENDCEEKQRLIELMSKNIGVHHSPSKR